MLGYVIFFSVSTLKSPVSKDCFYSQNAWEIKAIWKNWRWTLSKRYSWRSISRILFRMFKLNFDKIWQKKLRDENIFNVNWFFIVADQVQFSQTLRQRCIRTTLCKLAAGNKNCKKVKMHFFKCYTVCLIHESTLK
jgi:hypothetical protein